MNKIFGYVCLMYSSKSSFGVQLESVKVTFRLLSIFNRWFHITDMDGRISGLMKSSRKLYSVHRQYEYIPGRFYGYRAI